MNGVLGESLRDVYLLIGYGCQKKFRVITSAALFLPRNQCIAIWRALPDSRT